MFFFVSVNFLYLCRMLKAFKYRLYPTKEQATLINKHIGATRFLYNLGLETKQIAYSTRKINLDCFTLIKQIPDLKTECEWLKEINSQTLQMALRNLDNAFTRFFKGQGKYPNFKKKHSGGSFNIPQNVKLTNDKLIIPKFKEGISIELHRPTKGTIKQATISRTPTGKYFVSVLCDTGEKLPTKAPIKEQTTIGIDMGIKAFITTSAGESYDNPKYLKKSLSQLKFVQRKFSKHKGKRTKQKLAKLHEKVANQRRDFLHKTSTALIRESQTICIEDLNIKGMMKNHRLAQAVGDVGWHTFVSMLAYKAEWNGVNILQIGRFEPSSKLCNVCGHSFKELSLSDREWTCSHCGTHHDRDENAAINIKKFALRNKLSGTESQTRDELPALVGVLTPEASIPLG